jgi:serine/threonine protein kinase
MSELGELAGYKLLRELGRGTMGTVYLARTPKDDFSVAIKRVHVLGSEEDRARLRREAEIMVELDHPNIMAVIDVIEDSNGIALVMPYAEGGTLAQRIQKGPMRAEEVAAIIGPIASALATAHTRGVLHRDVKPSNIVFTSDGLALLTDFGIARDNEHQTITRTDFAIGTAGYLDPDIADGAQPNPGSDQYALGVVAYEALVGLPPFAAPTPLGVLRNSDRGDHQVLDPSRFGPLATVIERSFSRQPQRRYSSMQSFCDALTDLYPDAVPNNSARAEVRVSVAPETTSPAPTSSAPTSPAQIDTSESMFAPPAPMFEAPTDRASDTGVRYGMPAQHGQTGDVSMIDADLDAEYGNGNESIDATQTFRRRQTPAALADATPARPSKKRGILALVGAVIISAGIGGGLALTKREKPINLVSLPSPTLPKCDAQTSAQCVATVNRINSGIAVSFANGSSITFDIGQQNDAIRVNNWFCGERATLALYRPSTGVIYYARDWPVDKTTPTELAADFTGIKNAKVGVGDRNRDGCADIALDVDGKRTWFIPVLFRNRLQRVPVASVPATSNKAANVAPLSAQDTSNAGA